MADNGLAAVHHMRWQPMETAPKDKPILIAVWDQVGPYYCLEVGWWENGYGDDDLGYWSHQLTDLDGGIEVYWAELPPHPPKPDNPEVYGHFHGIA